VQVRLTNEKIAAVLTDVPGAVEAMKEMGWVEARSYTVYSFPFPAVHYQYERTVWERAARPVRMGQVCTGAPVHHEHTVME